MRLVLNSIKQKIISHPDDQVGVCFFSSKHSLNDNSFANIYVHTPLQPLTAATIRTLDALIEDTDAFERTIGSMSERECERGVHMDKILWVCSTLFQSAPLSSHSHRRIILITNNDTH